MRKPNLKHLGLTAVLAAGLAGLPGLASAERGDRHGGYTRVEYGHGGSHYGHSERRHWRGHHDGGPRHGYHGGGHGYRHYQHYRPHHYGHGYRPHHYGHHVHGPHCGHHGYGDGHGVSLGLLLGYTALYGD